MEKIPYPTPMGRRVYQESINEERELPRWGVHGSTRLKSLNENYERISKKISYLYRSCIHYMVFYILGIYLLVSWSYIVVHIVYYLYYYLYLYYVS